MCGDCVKILLDSTDKRSWEEQKQDWSLLYDSSLCYDYYSMQTKGDPLVLSNQKPEAEYCICGVAIVHQFIVYNDKRLIAYLMGSVCICRYRETDKTDRGAFNGNIVMENQMGELHRYFCDICNKTVSIEQRTKHEASATHEKKFLMKYYRICTKCKQYTIDKNKPAYFHTCSACYVFKPKAK